MDSTTMTYCRECKGEVAREAKACPHCAARTPGFTSGSSMPTIITILAAVLIGVWLVAANSGSNEQPVAPKPEIAIVQNDPPPTVEADGCTVPNHEDSEKFGLLLNLNHLLCAKAVKVCSLRVRDALEVTCIEYRGGSATKTYIVDVKTDTAFEQ